jgi:LysR family transcriptional regulator, glycine cleavage system transcriptional activator
MSRRLPPFKSIEAFVLAARALSFTEAASVLNLTVPAVSRRIQALETELGVSLFERSHRALQLTDAGETYLSHLAPAIETIRRASEYVRGSRGQSLRISLPASLVANWLVPRLPSFHAEHRGIELELHSMNGHADLDGSDADLAIWPGTGAGDWPGLRAERLLDMNVYPVCSADFLTRRPSLRSVADLVAGPLLGIAGQHDLWSAWLQAAGVAGPGRVQRAFDNFHLLYRAAASGLGVALGVDVIVRPYLEQEQLVRPFNVSCKLTKGYYVVGRNSDWTRGPIRSFREWLLRQAEPP